MNLKDLHAIFLSSPGVCTDTRKLHQGELFFALKGENFDGNSYVKEALSKGCRLAVCEDSRWAADERVFVAESALDVLQGLANFHRRQLNATVLAITGSNGKTSTKELVAAVLAEKYKVLYTEGNLNNHIGVPLTLLRLTDEEIAVIEMGANHPGEIALLCNIAEPDLGIITNIGKAHLEGFGSLEGVRKAKGELYDYLALEEKKILINADDNILMEMAVERKLDAVYYGSVPGALVSGTRLDTRAFVSGSLEIDGSAFPVSTKLVGKYNFTNILAAAASGVFFKVDHERIVAAIADYLPTNNRSQFMEGKSNSLILDAYNANPTSLLASLEDFAADKSARKIAILGEMLELGEESEKEHKLIIEWLRGSGIEEVILVGEGFAGLSTSSDDGFMYFTDIQACMQYLESRKPSGSKILLKGSRKNTLEEATNLLLNC